MAFAAAWFFAPDDDCRHGAEFSPRQTLQQARVLGDEKRPRKWLRRTGQYLQAKPDDDDVRASVAKLLSWQANGTRLRPAIATS